MVKGVSKRVIVVKSPDPRIFEQAIFIVREDYVRHAGDADRVLREARQAARAYVRGSAATKKRGLLERVPPALIAAAGAAATGIAWLMMRLVGV